MSILYSKSEIYFKEEPKFCVLDEDGSNSTESDIKTEKILCSQYKIK